jgi:NAD(P)-dependent dehydrogenase (short-subunit alcohol dehydrogenase family)
VSSAASRLVLAEVDAAVLADTAMELGASAVPTDVSDPRAMEALAAAAPDAELLCLNAGIVGTAMGPPWEVSPGEWDAVFAVNVGGVVNGLRAFVDPDRPLRAFGRVGVTAELVENSHPRMLA